MSAASLAHHLGLPPLVLLRQTEVGVVTLLVGLLLVVYLYLTR
jgi:hypothetical protein